MRVAILGVGGLGRTLASELRADRRVTSLLLTDQFGERARVLTGIPGRVSIEATQLNVENHAALGRAIKGSDIVVNTTLPRYNLRIMGAALGAGADYFKAAGRTALVSMGFDPGISNVMARDAAERFEAIDAIRIRAGELVTTPGPGYLPLSSREAFLENILVRPSVWLDGGLAAREPLSEPEDFPFPAPVGVQRTYLVSHEEVETLPRFLGKPVGRVDYKHALHPDVVRALISLDRLGLLSDSRMIRIGNQMVSFRRALLAAFPEPSALVLPLQGATALTVEVEGMRDGHHIVRRGDVLMSQPDANRRRSTTAVNYLTAVGAAIGVAMLGDQTTPGPGVHPPETLDRERVFKEWAARELPMQWSERAVAA